VCSFDSNDCVMLFSENKYDDDDDSCLVVMNTSSHVCQCMCISVKRISIITVDDNLTNHIYSRKPDVISVWQPVCFK